MPSKDKCAIGGVANNILKIMTFIGILTQENALGVLSKQDVFRVACEKLIAQT